MTPPPANNAALINSTTSGGGVTGLYVHIPFCVKKCHYCNFVVTSVGSVSKRDDFLKALAREAAAHRARFAGTPFDTLYIGGGTPSTMDLEETESLFTLIKDNFQFAGDAEISVEVNPGDITQAKAVVYKRLGVNRVSLGAQSFREETLSAANRAHGSAAIGQTVRYLREAGIDNLSLDLMLAMPDETLDDVRGSLESALALAPEHLSLYELTMEDKTVFGERRKKGQLALPDESLSLKMLTLARDFLKHNGYCHYELLSYAKPGFESRHNMIYWTDGDYLGLGPGAYSYFDGRRFKVASDYESYIEKAGQNDFSPIEEESLKGEAAARESFILAMRLAEGAPLSSFASFLPAVEPSLKKLESQGLIERNTSHCLLTSRGQFFSETVFTELSS